MLHDRFMRAARSLALLCLALFAAAPAGADQITDSARTIWRDYTVDGVPTSGAWNPRKGDIRTFGALVGSSITALQAAQTGAALAFDTKANLDASLAYAANTQAFVYADSTPDNNGIYRKNGASGAGSWTKVSALVYGPTPTFGLGTVTVTACNTSPAAALGGTALAPVLNLSFPSCNYDGAIPLPTPTTTARGGVIATPTVAHQFVTGLDAGTGDLVRAQPVAGDLGDIAADTYLGNAGAAPAAPAAVSRSNCNGATKALNYTPGSGESCNSAIHAATSDTVTTNANLTGDVTSVGNATTIAANAVTNAKAAQMPASSVKCNNTGGSANPIDCTASQATALLSVMVGDSGSGGVKGLVAAPAAGDAAAGKVWGASGSWVAASSFTQSGTGAVTRTVQDRLRDTINVTDFGAVADSTGVGTGTDNLTAFQNALNAAKTAGKALYIPGGGYRISSALSLDYSALADDTSARISILGEPGASRLFFDAGSYNGLTVSGASAFGAGAQLYIKISGIALRKADNLGAGLSLVRAAYVDIESVTAVGWETGFYAQDFLSSSIRKSVFRFNNYGFYAERLSYSYPNALSFEGTTIGNNNFGGLVALSPTTLTYVGGSIEGNGDAAHNIGGAYINGGPIEGGVGASFYGVYFENNKGQADIYVASSVSPGTININGCTFNRISATNYVTNNIFSSGTSYLAFNVSGSSFAGLGAYSPDAGRPYVNLTSTNARLNWDPSNTASSAVEAVLPNGDHTTPGSYARVVFRFDGTLSSPVPINSHNVASIAKNATGDYNINYAKAFLDAGNSYSAMTSAGGWVSLFAESSSSLRIRTFNGAGTLADGFVTGAVFSERW